MDRLQQQPGFGEQLMQLLVAGMNGLTGAQPPSTTMQGSQYTTAPNAPNPPLHHSGVMPAQQPSMGPKLQDAMQNRQQNGGYQGGAAPSMLSGGGQGGAEGASGVGQAVGSMGFPQHNPEMQELFKGMARALAGYNPGPHPPWSEGFNEFPRPATNSMDPAMLQLVQGLFQPGSVSTDGEMRMRNDINTRKERTRVKSKGKKKKDK